jgi:hypothetical protein
MHGNKLFVAKVLSVNEWDTALPVQNFRVFDTAISIRNIFQDSGSNWIRTTCLIFKHLNTGSGTPEKLGMDAHVCFKDDYFEIYGTTIACSSPCTRSPTSHSALRFLSSLSFASLAHRSFVFGPFRSIFRSAHMLCMRLSLLIWGRCNVVRTHLDWGSWKISGFYNKT